MNFKLNNLDDFVEDSMIKDIRISKEKQIKREEDEIKKNIIMEKVFFFCMKDLFYLFNSRRKLKRKMN